MRDQVRAHAGLGDLPVRAEQWRDVMGRLLARNEAAAKQHSSSGVVARCRACDSPIWWGETELGKRMSLDPLARPMGNVIRVPAGKRMVLRVLASRDLPVVGRPAYQSHFASCPFADELRRRRERREAHADERGHVSLCRVCGRVMDPWLPGNGYTAHPNCDPTEEPPSTDRGSEA